jgi:hypothetical protein
MEQPGRSASQNKDEGLRRLKVVAKGLAAVAGGLIALCARILFPAPENGDPGITTLAAVIIFILSTGIIYCLLRVPIWIIEGFIARRQP